VESNDQKILFWEWIVKDEFAFRKCPYFPAGIDDLHLKSAQNGKIGQPWTTGRKIARKQVKISPAGRGLSQDSLGLFPKDRRVPLVIDETQNSYPAFPKAIFRTQLPSSFAKS